MSSGKLWLRWGVLILVGLAAIGAGYFLMRSYLAEGPLLTPEEVVQALEDRGYEIQDLSMNTEDICWPGAAVTLNTDIAGEQHYVAVASCPNRSAAWRYIYLFYMFRRERDFTNTACFSRGTLVFHVMPRDRVAVRELRRIVRSIPRH